jgi:hypothetical protein
MLNQRYEVFGHKFMLQHYYSATGIHIRIEVGLRLFQTLYGTAVKLAPLPVLSKACPFNVTIPFNSRLSSSNSAKSHGKVMSYFQSEHRTFSLGTCIPDASVILKGNTSVKYGNEFDGTWEIPVYGDSNSQH